MKRKVIGLFVIGIIWVSLSTNLAEQQVYELYYDDDAVDGYISAYAGGVLVNQFYTKHSVLIKEISFYFGTSEDVEIFIWDSNCEEKFSQRVHTKRGWNRYDVSDNNIVIEHEPFEPQFFYVGVKQLFGFAEGKKLLGVDSTPPHHGENFKGMKQNLKKGLGNQDYMIRCKVECLSGNCGSSLTFLYYVGDLEVHVMDEDNNPLERVNIILNGIKRGETNSAGACTILNLKAGEYLLKIEKEGFIFQEKNIEIITNKNIKKTLIMEKEKLPPTTLPPTTVLSTTLPPTTISPPTTTPPPTTPAEEKEKNLLETIYNIISDAYGAIKSFSPPIMYLIISIIALIIVLLVVRTIGKKEKTKKKLSPEKEEKIKKQIEGNKLYLKNLKIMYERGEVRKEIYERMKKRYEDKIEVLEKKLNE